MTEEIKTEPKKRQIVLTEQRFGLAEALRRDFVVDAEVGTTLQDVLEPAYWAYVTRDITPFSRIEVRMETGEWIAELVVMQVDRTWAKVHLLHFHDLAPSMDTAPPSQKHQVYWRGMHHKFAVRRLSDQEVIQSNFATRDEANVWLKNYEGVTA